jgi:hypothetical protein
MLAMRGRRALERGREIGPCAAAARLSAAARSADEANAVSSASMRPGNRAVISWNSQPLPSGSLNEANEL